MNIVRISITSKSISSCFISQAKYTETREIRRNRDESLKKRKNHVTFCKKNVMNLCRLDAHRSEESSQKKNEPIY